MTDETTKPERWTAIKILVQLPASIDRDSVMIHERGKGLFTVVVETAHEEHAAMAWLSDNLPLGKWRVCVRHDEPPADPPIRRQLTPGTTNPTMGKS